MYMFNGTAIFNYVGQGSECAYPLGLWYLIICGTGDRMCTSPGTEIFIYWFLGARGNQLARLLGNPRKGFVNNSVEWTDPAKWIRPKRTICQTVQHQQRYYNVRRSASDWTCGRTLPVNPNLGQSLSLGLACLNACNSWYLGEEFL